MTVTAHDIVGAMQEACTKILDRVDYLNELDATMGDGEHGSNMSKSFTMLKRKLDGWNSSDKSGLLQMIGKTLLSSGGGTATTLFGIFFVYAGMQAGKVRDEWDAASLNEIIHFAYGNLQKRSTAKLGDKTLIDALEPAVTAFTAMAQAGSPLSASLEGAVQAAENGAADTVGMLAKKGRGVYIGERGLGTLDPGAVSVSLIVRSWASYCDKMQSREVLPNTLPASNG
jgi:dihydroxyacetone kinase-like protein